MKVYAIQPLNSLQSTRSLGCRNQTKAFTLITFLFTLFLFLLSFASISSSFVVFPLIVFWSLIILG